MRAPGIIGMVQLATTLAIAAPLLFFGLEWLATGRTVLGGALVALGLAMLVTQRYITHPLDPANVAGRTAERLRREGKE